MECVCGKSDWYIKDENFKVVYAEKLLIASNGSSQGIAEYEIEYCDETGDSPVIVPIHCEHCDDGNLLFCYDTENEVIREYDRVTGILKEQE